MSIVVFPALKEEERSGVLKFLFFPFIGQPLSVWS